MVCNGSGSIGKGEDFSTGKGCLLKGCSREVLERAVQGHCTVKVCSIVANVPLAPSAVWKHPSTCRQCRGAGVRGGRVRTPTCSAFHPSAQKQTVPNF